MKWYKTHILATASFRDPDPMFAQCNVQALAQKKTAPGGIPKVPALENQKDLMKMVSVLLSTGINRNDDVFLPSEVLPVRNTGAHKPVNMEHDPNKIVGHIIRTFATEKSGKRVPDGKKPKGKQFDITAESVIYSFLFPRLANEIRERAEANELFVSVEVWFTDFDFLVGNKVVKRTSETASILEPKLRINGGTGTFEGQKLGRVLRNMIIGGKGVVRDPANPESIIKSVSTFNSEVVQEIEDETVCENVVCDLFDNEASGLEEVVEIEITEEPMNPDLIEEMAAVAAACDAAADQAETEVVETPEAATEEHVEEQATASVDLSKNPVFQQLLAKVSGLEADNKELKDAKKAAEFKAECSRRESKLREMGFADEEQLADILTSRTMFSMSKEQFDQYCDLLTRGLNQIGQATASTEEPAAEETTEVTAEAEEQETAEAPAAEETPEEAPEEVTEPADETTEEVTAEDTSETGEATEETIEDEIEVEIEAVDPEINTKTGDTNEEPDLVSQMADVAQLFLKQKDEKWGKLALNR